MVTEAMQERRDKARDILYKNRAMFEIAKVIGINSLQGVCANLISLNIGRFWNNFDNEADDRGGNSASNFELAAHILRELRLYATPEIINALVVELGRAQEQMEVLDGIDWSDLHEEMLKDNESTRARQIESAFMTHRRKESCKDRRAVVTSTERYYAHSEYSTDDLCLTQINGVRRLKGIVINPFLMQGEEKNHSIELKINIEWDNGQKGATGQQFLITAFIKENQSVDVDFVVPYNVPDNFGLCISAKDQQTGEVILTKQAMNASLQST